MVMDINARLELIDEAQQCSTDSRSGHQVANEVKDKHNPLAVRHFLILENYPSTISDFALQLETSSKRGCKNSEGSFDFLGLLTTLDNELLIDLEYKASTRKKLAEEEISLKELDFNITTGEVIKLIASDVKTRTSLELMALELMEYAIPAGNVISLVRKSFQISDSKLASNEFELMDKLRGKVGVVQCMEGSLHEFIGKSSVKKIGPEK
ncbi:hypothetical protein F2Q69_00057367 [Brassica cretica]|uniref:Uncharacterized protein n=1 Tax=Brassica cretica TaxID=69181 RepID=A0A8S9MS36_BRACR|nr:hypothetical protein F2Q69_00057367 [Brassica cretica]